MTQLRELGVRGEESVGAVLGGLADVGWLAIHNV